MMKQSIRYTGKTRSFPAGMALSAGVSILITLAMAAGIAYSMNSERITWEQAGYWIIALLFLASFGAGKTAYGTIRRQRLAVCMLAGLLYWGLLLLTTALFFGGELEGVGVTAGIICGGSGCAALMNMPERRKKLLKNRRGNG